MASATVITYVYALKNAISPTLTVVGLTVAFALTGTFFVEIIFNWPGLGLFTVRSLLNIDYPAIMGMTLFGATGYVLINLGVDFMQAWIDPRISLRIASDGSPDSKILETSRIRQIRHRGVLFFSRRPSMTYTVEPTIIPSPEYRGDGSHHWPRPLR